MQNKNILRIALVTVGFLLVPLVAMQFTGEVNWTLSDFIFAGGLIFGTGLAYELISKKRTTVVYKSAVGVALAAVFLLIWANGAVGLIGNENNPANVLYFSVLATGLIGATIARLQPRGMSRTLFAMAAVHVFVPVVAMFIWRASVSDLVNVVGVTGFFATFFVVSALLFQQAGEKMARA